MKVPLRAGTWPETEFVFRAAWIGRRRQILPSQVRLPSGRQIELFLAGAPDFKPLAWKTGKYTFEFKPQTPTLTEFLNPKGMEITAPDGNSPAARIIIR